MKVVQKEPKYADMPLSLLYREKKEVRKNFQTTFMIGMNSFIFMKAMPGFL
ncbi:hypothetical protein [Sinobaca sp. H24]|uniref:hypothetical protein n=1 Tax=Sinobaca sp. H24 TaxID=2923376 RepID=UPI00207A1CF1|nr:hypothetical protein [Sinobaca sp. H24]